MSAAPWLLSVLLVLAYAPQLRLAWQANRDFQPAPTGLPLALGQAAILLCLVALPHLLPEAGIALLGVLLLMGANVCTQLWHISAHGAREQRDRQVALLRASGVGRSMALTALSRSFVAALGLLILLAPRLGLEPSWLGYGIVTYAVVATAANAFYYPRWIRGNEPATEQDNRAGEADESAKSHDS